VKTHGLEGLVAKRRSSKYEPGQRSGAWRKMRVNKGQELVIGGYTPSDKNFDAQRAISTERRLPARRSCQCTIHESDQRRDESDTGN
jgi:hypothetical protein